MTATDIASKAMNVAADMCIYTNKEFLVHTLELKKEGGTND
jgi:ATP-dependent protease HslVU (ClpYQ) peptidase subunit